MSEEIIAIKGLCKSFKNVTAVSNVDIYVKEGELFGLIGPDGAGKTTTIRMLCGIITPDQGEGKILGYDFKNEKEKIKSKIGYVSQKFSLYEDLTVDENIEFFAKIHNLKDYKKEKEKLLELTGLIEARNRLVGRLSGGMKQKLALISTLIHKPKLIFLDEPTTGVDLVSRRELWKVLFSLLAEEITIFISTPYLDEADRCNSIALIKDGIIIAADKLEKFKNSFKKIIYEFTINEIKNKLQNFNTNFPAIQYKTFGDRLHVFLTKREEIKNIKHFFEKNDIKILNIRQIAPTVEHIFLEMIKEKK